MPQQKMS